MAAFVLLLPVALGIPFLPTMPPIFSTPNPHPAPFPQALSLLSSYVCRHLSVLRSVDSLLTN